MLLTSRGVRQALPFVVATVVALAGCARTATEGLPPGVEIEDLPDSEAWDVAFRTSADGQARTAVEAAYLARYTRDSSYAYLGRPPGDSAAAPVTLRTFDRNGVAVGSVRAPEVWLYDDEGRVVALQARATVPTGDGASIEAQRLVLVGGRIDATGNVKATRSGADGASVQAARITMEDGRIEAAGDVTASVLSGGGARIEAARLVTRPGGSFTASGGATVQIQGRANATVRARTVSGSGGRYTADGGVTVVTQAGKTLTAGRVVWNEGAGEFRAPGAFSFTGPGERVRGVGLVASADLSRYSFRQASGEIEVQE